MSPSISRNFGKFSKKSVHRVFVTPADIEVSDFDGNNEMVMDTIHEIEADPERQGHIKTAIKKLQNTIRKQSPEERAEMLNSPPMLDGTTYTEQEMKQAYQDGQYAKRKSKARYMGRTAIGLLTAAAAGVGITGVVLVCVTSAGFIILAPMLGAPLVVVLLLVPIGMSIEAAARDRRNYTLPGGKPSNEDYHNTNSTPAYAPPPMPTSAPTPMPTSAPTPAPARAT